MTGAASAVAVAAAVGAAICLLAGLVALAWIYGAKRAGSGATTNATSQTSVSAGVPINVHSRGDPEPYRLVGRLAVRDTATDQSKTQRNNVLQLWGRLTYDRSYRWNYYILMDNGVKLPLEDDRGRSCETDIGCPEISDGDIVTVRELGGATYTFTRYQNDAPRYLPNKL